MKSQQLKNLFSQTPRFYFQKNDALTKPTELTGQKIWIVSRALIVHKFFPLTDQLKGKRRFNYINLQVRTLSPFAKTGTYMHWTDKGVSVWMWDQHQLATLVTKYELNPADFTFIPETAYVTPHLSGARLIECLEGYEGQIWHDNQLMASRWWKTQPTENDWLQFWRGVGTESLNISQNLPPLVAHTHLNEKTWTHARPIAGGLTIETFYSTEALALYTLLLLFPITFYAGKIVHAWGSTSSMNSTIDAMGTDTSKVEAEKKAAEGNLKKINAIMALNTTTNPLHVLKQVTESMSDPDLLIVEFNMTGDLATLMFEHNKTPDPASIVRMLETIPNFEQVSPEASGVKKNTLKVTFKIKKNEVKKK